MKKIALILIALMLVAGAAVAIAAEYSWNSDGHATLGRDGRSWKQIHLGGSATPIILEGLTSDAYETVINAVEPTADRTITFPDASGTVQLTSGDGVVNTTNILNGTVGNADMAVNAINASNIIDNTVSSADILNATIADTDISATAEIAISKLAECPDGQIIIGNASGASVCVEVSGFATLANSGALAGATNGVRESHLFQNSLTFTVNPGVGYATATVTSGMTINSVSGAPFPTTAIGNGYFINDVTFDGATTATLTVANGSASAIDHGTGVYRMVVIE